MKWKVFFAYVQREMNKIFKKFSYIQTYIDNIIVFHNTFEKYLKHLPVIFVLFKNWNITFKTIKTYLKYFNISLLKQKINNFELVIAENKLKTINKLKFFESLKNLEIHFEIIEYFRNYIFHYAQKSKLLNKKKLFCWKKIRTKKQFAKISIKNIVKKRDT